MKSPDLILFCSCSGRGFVPDSEKESVMSSLRSLGSRSVSIPDLCGMAAQNKAGLLALINNAGSIAVIACHPRTIKGLFAMAGVTRDSETTTILNLRELGIAKTLQQIAEWSGEAQDRNDMVIVGAAQGQWDPWFPVIDYDRCKNCKQCMSFCLFGVYEAGADGVAKVNNPLNCKNNCPACARICPEAAIIFPKYTEAPINGAEITDEQGVREKIKVNVDEILGDDIYAALTERRKKARTLLLKKRDIEQAELERSRFSEQTITGESK